jgi:hypothetical protein
VLLTLGKACLSSSGVAAVEMPVEASLGHQLVDKQEAVAAVAPAQELHEVAMLEPADDPQGRFRGRGSQCNARGQCRLGAMSICIYSICISVFGS